MRETTDSPQTELHGHKLDLWGLQVRTVSDACIQHINSYYLEVLTYGSNQKVILKAVEHDHSCALALALSALHSLKSSSSDALSLLAAAKSCVVDATLYEKMAITAAEALVEGHCDVALSAYSKILEHFPRDLVSLKRAQLLCFNMGKSDESLRLTLKVLPANKEAAYMNGMLAFSLLETRHYDDAEEAARKALSIEKTDQWAQHALCHVLQYRCLFQEAILFMEKNKESWNSCCSFMYSHNWWHLALLYMEWGCNYALDKVVEIYDFHIWPARCRDLGGSVQVSLNALGLLLRLELRGYADRVQACILPVAEQLYDTALWHKERLLDLLAIWALAYVGQSSKSYAFLEQLEHRVYSVGHKEQESLEMFLKLAKGLYEYGRGNSKQAFDVLGPLFNTDLLKVIGASDEQLDVFEELWCIVSLRSGHFQEVSEVLKRRTTTFHGSPFAWELMEEFHNMTGSPDKAQSAAMQAGSIKKSYVTSMSTLRL